MDAPRDFEHGFLPQADALAYGMTTALRRGYNGKRPRTRYTSVTKREGTSANVLVYNRNDPSIPARVMPASSFGGAASGSTPHRAKHENVRQERYIMTCADMAPIGNIE